MRPEPARRWGFRWCAPPACCARTRSPPANSGIKPQTLDLIVAMLERGVTPAVAVGGSLGASGDLAPLAHMTLTLIGEGEA